MPPNAPLVVKKCLAPTHSAKLQGGALYDQVLAVHARLQVFSHQIQSPFQFLWKQPSPYGTLQSLAQAPHFDTDKAMEFLQPFYSATGRLAKNQPRILRSFILFYFLCSACLAKPSLTLWADRLRDERVLAALIGYAQDSLPPLGFCFDFLWTDSGLHRKQSYMPGINCFPLPETTKGLISLKGKS